MMGKKSMHGAIKRLSTYCGDGYGHGAATIAAAVPASEQIAMGADAGEANFRFVCFVHQKSVWSDMAFSLWKPVPDERMVSILQRKGLSGHQDVKHSLQFGNVIMATVAEFQVALELSSVDFSRVEHVERVKMWKCKEAA